MQPCAHAQACTQTHTLALSLPSPPTQHTHPHAVLLGDIGEKAAGRVGRSLVYATIYSLDATRCIILHLAATQSLFHALAPSVGDAMPMWRCSAVVAVVVLLLGQIRRAAKGL